MVDWVTTFVRGVTGKDDTLLLIRAHPAEDKLPPEFRSKKTVKQLLLNELGSLPENVRVIPGASDISSYGLFELSDVNGVYTSTLGLEIALKGIKPYVADFTHYGKKGFTHDILHKDEVEDILKTTKKDNMLDEVQTDLAYRYAYIWLFLSLFRPQNLSRGRDRYSFDDYKGLVSKGSEYYRLFESIVKHETYCSADMRDQAFAGRVEPDETIKGEII
jgi:hypothetical protein